ncbi:uncharacterized protein LOC133891972 isoform X2 [Phragmites australis]|nr:uncharacterized protein LOC133891972 isoform X2 [Phragmites australis]
MKMLIDDEVSGDLIPKHTSPGIVGRLMGLDTMPSFGVHSHSTYSGSHSHNMSPGSSSDKYGFYGDVSHRRSTDEIPEFKDVFEVMEATRMKNQSQKSRRSNIYSGLDMVNSADMNFVRQKFMDAKRLSSDESFQRSKEFDDALEALVSNKDFLLKFLQESDHIPTIDLPDLSSPFSSVNRITVLKPSRRSKFIDADVIYPLEEDTERCYCAEKEEKHSPRKPCVSLSSQPSKEEAGSFRRKLSRSSYQERIGTHVSPTRIVVLKPCLGKIENMEGAFYLTHEMFQSSYRKPKAPLDDDNGTRNPRTEEYMYQMSTGESDVLGRSGKGSVEIAHEVTKQMRRAVKGGVSGKRILNPDIGMFNWDEQASSLSSMAKLKSSEAYQRSTGRHDARDAPSCGYSPTYSAKTSIRKEAKRRLSDRWKMTRQYQHPSQDANTFSTLGDMLALSDKEVSKLTSGSAACRKCPKGELHRDGMPGSCGYPLGISSNDGWKDESVCNSTRLKSLSSSSITRKNPKLSSRKENCRHNEISILKDILVVGPNSSEDELVHGRSMRSPVRCSTHHSDESDVPSLEGEESAVIEREIHVNFEELTCSTSVPDSSEERTVQPASSNHKLGAQFYSGSSCVVPEWQDEAQASAAQNLVMHQEPVLTLDNHHLSSSPRDSATQAERNAHDQYKGNPTPSSPSIELVSHMSHHEDDQPSPVSVLESSLDAEDGCSGGFEKISADLQELRMQLRLLKMEATDDADGTELISSSDDEISDSCKPLSETGQASDTFWDADERDVSYVLDMLTCLGIQSDEQDFLLNACYSWECPAGGAIYESLEKKYSRLILWPQSERRLLFDLTNDALMDVIACLTHCGSQWMLKKWQSKWDKEGVLEEVWGRVCRQRREAECFQEERLMGVGWLDCEDVTNQIVGEIGSMLDEDLLEEVIDDLLL